jgi:hypothetical protein
LGVTGDGEKKTSAVFITEDEKEIHQHGHLVQKLSEKIESTIR